MILKHIFFDLDHTLWDFEKNSALTFEQVFKEQNIQIPIQNFLNTYKPINFNYWKLYREDRISKTNLRYGRLKDTFDVLNIVVSDQMIHTISEEYIRVLPNFNHLFEGTKELLEYLEKKYELHIITNGFEEVQTLKLENSGIINYFDKIITSESVGVKKPNPKVFEFALEATNALPKESMMIGDNLEADIFGAINCGLDTIYCDLEKVGNSDKKLKTVTSLLEIKQYI